MRYLLIHGAWHTSRTWAPLVLLLQQLGHEVSCIDLPGTPLNPKDTTEVSYQDYYNTVVQALEGSQPVVLVAHSMAGIIAAPIQDAFPDKVKHLFLVAAFVAQNGQSLLSLAMTQKDSPIRNHMHMDFLSGTQSIDAEGARKIFYADCPASVADREIKDLVPQPFAPMLTAISWSDTGKAKGKRTYILCEKDKAVSPELQMTMATSLECTITTLPCGHSPYLSHPSEFLKIITSIS